MNMNQVSKKIAAVIALATLAGASMAADKMSVQSEEAVIRATPAPFGAKVATAKYGDRLTVIAQQGAWSQVQTDGGASGWTQTASLTKAKVVLQAGSSDVSRTASGEELALAGKGFNSQVEGQFKANNPNVDFKWIDYMEKIKISEPQMIQFLRAGGLKGGN
jgi:uncharacterized protein YgiM (DUF1202 family)